MSRRSGSGAEPIEVRDQFAVSVDERRWIISDPFGGDDVGADEFADEDASDGNVEGVEEFCDCVFPAFDPDDGGEEAGVVGEGSDADEAVGSGASQSSQAFVFFSIPGVVVVG